MFRQPMPMPCLLGFARVGVPVRRNLLMRRLLERILKRDERPCPGFYQLLLYADDNTLRYFSGP